MKYKKNYILLNLESEDRIFQIISQKLVALFDISSFWWRSEFGQYSGIWTNVCISILIRWANPFDTIIYFIDCYWTLPSHEATTKFWIVISYKIANVQHLFGWCNCVYRIGECFVYPESTNIGIDTKVYISLKLLRIWFIYLKK